MNGEIVRRIFGVGDSDSLFVGEDKAPLFAERLVSLSGKKSRQYVILAQHGQSNARFRDKATF